MKYVCTNDCTAFGRRFHPGDVVDIATGVSIPKSKILGPLFEVINVPKPELIQAKVQVTVEPEPVFAPEPEPKPEPDPVEVPDAEVPETAPAEKEEKKPAIKATSTRRQTITKQRGRKPAPPEKDTI